MVHTIYQAWHIAIVWRAGCKVSRFDKKEVESSSRLCGYSEGQRVGFSKELIFQTTSQILHVVAVRGVVPLAEMEKRLVSQINYMATFTTIKYSIHAEERLRSQTNYVASVKVVESLERSSKRLCDQAT